MEDSNYLGEIMFIRNLTYQQLANRSGVGRSTLYRIATFKQTPTQHTMIKISRALGMKVTDVFNLDY